MEFRSDGTGRREDLLENRTGVDTQAEQITISKHVAPSTRGTGMSFGFRRRPTSGIPMPVTTCPPESKLLHPRSRSAGPEQEHRYDEDNSNAMIQNFSSGRSTPRLVPPKNENNGVAVRINRFGYRQSQSKVANKLEDICGSHPTCNYNQPQRMTQVFDMTSASKIRSSSGHSSVLCNSTQAEPNRKTSGITETVGRYTLHASHLPLPQYAVRMPDTSTKVAKTVANQCKKISTVSKSSTCSKEITRTVDSITTQQGSTRENDMRSVDVDRFLPKKRTPDRPRNLRTVVNQNSFDVRNIRDDDSTVTEISVIPLPKSFGASNTGMVGERTSHYQRMANKDNRYTESTTSMSTTSSEGCDEGLSEEKGYKDRSHSEKILSNKSDFSPPSSDDPEYGHGEAMADEYSLSFNDECQRANSTKCLQTVLNVPKNTLRSVLLTIEDPAFAAVAATSTTLIDDETSPVDSLFDSLTTSITQPNVRAPKKEHPMERSGNTIDDESSGTPTNASNSLSLSESKEYFDDEIADQPGLVFDDGEEKKRSGETQSHMTSQVVTDNNYTLIESNVTTGGGHEKTAVNSPHNSRRLNQAGSVDTLSPCESIAPDDLILDYEHSDTSSYEEQIRLGSDAALHDIDDATILSELEAQGEEVMRQWTSLLGTCQAKQQTNNSNAVNNNVNGGAIINNYHATNEIGSECEKLPNSQTNRSLIDSPRCLDAIRNHQFPTPLRTRRNILSPSVDSGDERNRRTERETYQHMYQDIVSIKTILLKLKRVLQENGLFNNLNEGGTADASTSPGTEGNNIADEILDLRRQVVFLQGQVEDKDRTIQELQFQVTKFQGSTGVNGETCTTPTDNGNIHSGNTCNAATQTEKVYSHFKIANSRSRH